MRLSSDGVRCDYGIDAPELVRFFFFAGASVGVVCCATWVFFAHSSVLLIAIATVLTVIAMYLLGMGMLMVTYSRVTKVRERERILDRVRWRGDERVLDVGCGRGLLVVAAARRLRSGHATGIDSWIAKDQSNNRPSGANENARIEGVEDRVTIETGDMRALPYDDETFDVVMSHWVVHNLEAESDRQHALAEMHRVLRPDGMLIVADIEHRDAYRVALGELGFAAITLDVQPLRDRLLRAASFGSFGPATISARKPAALA